MTRLSVEQLAVGPMMNFAYLVADEEAKVCAVVDPGWDAATIEGVARRRGWRIEKILLTHAHFDHAGALRDLARSSGAAVYVHEAEIAEVPDGISAIATGEGSTIAIGALEVRCLHTPGHTAGSQCFVVEGALFTGDTLFIDGCGRVDLPGSDPARMVGSLRRLAGLDPSLVVYPGHDYGGAPSATVGELVRSNPYLSANSADMLL